MFFSFSTGLWSHVKRVNLLNNLELNGFCYKLDFILSDLIIFTTAWQSNNIFFWLLDNNVLKHIFEGNFQYIKSKTEGNIDYRKWIQILN